MRVAAFQREDRTGRLQVLVQGLGRVRIVRATQATPFARVDAEMMVDAETVAAWEAQARAVLAGEQASPAIDKEAAGAASDAEGAAEPSSRYFGEGATSGEGRMAGAGDGGGDEADGGGGGGASGVEADARKVMRLAMAGAAAAEEAWRTYDAADGFDGDGTTLPATVIPWNTSVGVEATRERAEGEGVRAMLAAIVRWEEEEASAAAAAAEAMAYEWGPVMDGSFMCEMEAVAADEAEAAAEQARAISRTRRERELAQLQAAVRQVGEVGEERAEELEVQCWVELDALLQAYAQANPLLQRTTPRMPAELLGLLPHQLPGACGKAWPEGFMLLNLLRLMGGVGGGGGGGGVGGSGDEASGIGGGGGGEGGGGSGSARVSEDYPSLRRASRLSFALPAGEASRSTFHYPTLALLTF